MSALMKMLRSCDACAGKKTIEWDRSTARPLGMFSGVNILRVRCEGCGAEVEVRVSG
jgi:hypothetical protein